jgi:hypothetical protein
MFPGYFDGHFSQENFRARRHFSRFLGLTRKISWARTPPFFGLARKMCPKKSLKKKSHFFKKFLLTRRRCPKNDFFLPRKSPAKINIGKNAFFEKTELIGQGEGGFLEGF